MTNHKPESYADVLRQLADLEPDPLLRSRYLAIADGEVFDVRLAQDVLTLARGLRNQSVNFQRALDGIYKVNRDQNGEIAELRNEAQQLRQKLRSAEAIARRSEATCDDLHRRLAAQDTAHRQLEAHHGEFERHLVEAKERDRRIDIISRAIQAIGQADPEIRDPVQRQLHDIKQKVQATMDLMDRVAALEGIIDDLKRERGGSDVS